MSQKYEEEIPTNTIQSSIPGMSVADIRSVLSEQRKLFQENGYVNLVDIVFADMNRMRFNYRYVNGIAKKRHQKHRRASTKKLREGDVELSSESECN